MATGNILVDWKPGDSLFPDWQSVLFSSGSTEPSLGDTIHDDISSANARLEYVALTFGSWAGGNAAGFMLLSNWNGAVWTSGGNFTGGADTSSNHGTFTGIPLDAVTTTQRRNNMPALIFPGSTVISSVASFQGILPSWYAGGGITAQIAWSSESSTTGDVDWWAAFKSITDNIDSIDTAVFAAAKSAISATTANVSGEVKYTDIAFANGAEIANLAVGELFQLLLFRDDNASTDTMASGAEVRSVELRET